ncbi:MAG: hypothetical protein ACOYN3_05600 [Acidimicrobiia bacterium]
MRVLNDTRLATARLARREGDWMMAVELAGNVMTTGENQHVQQAVLIVHDVMVRQGRREEAEPYLQFAIDRCGSREARRFLQCALADIAVARGEADRARSLFDEAFHGLTMLDTTNPDQLETYATVLERHGEVARVHWARTRAQHERTWQQAGLQTSPLTRGR